MAAMDEDDLGIMQDTAIRSIEVNGNGDHATTIDPSKISFHTNSPEFLSPKLPLHGVGNPLNVASAPSPFSARHQSGSRTQKSSPELGSDAMDITPPRQTAVEVRVPPPPRFPPLPYSSSKTGLVYDTRMRFHAEYADFMSSPDDIHPEDPRRINEIFNEIHQAGLVQGPSDPDEDAHEDQCWWIHARPATAAEICLIHTAEHFRFIESLQHLPAMELKQLSDNLDSIYFNNATYDCALLAAGGAIEACRAVVRGDVKNAIAIIRPPGHHAESDAPSGFCIFNNVPVATRVCQKDFPETCRKVLILDWDVHHGNGIQHAFYDDPNVLYISLHVFRGGNFYPNLPDGDYNYCGEGPGQGRNVNIPWDEHGMGDAEYIYAFQEVVMPIATEFDPDLVIISAGFDAAEGDVLGGCHVTPACYAHMTHMLMRVANGKMAVCLEGGYNLRSIARSALAVTRTLMLQPPDRLAENLEPKESAVRTIQQVKRQQSKYWRCLYPKQVDKNDPTFQATIALHKIIREWQSGRLYQKHRMTPLAINKAGLDNTFEHNVLVTPGFMEKHPLLVVFHDPPTTRSTSDPVTGQSELHNTWLADVVSKDYVGWAIENGFQVIDVNIPKVVSIEDEDGSYISADDIDVRAHQTRELAAYIWENYIEPHEATQVFFMGVGAAYMGLVDLLGNYESCTDDDSIVQGLIGFVSENSIQSIKRPTDDNISSWYHRHSLIFVKGTHAVWDPDRRRKLRRKWGRLVQSEKEKIDDMLSHHRAEVQEHLLKKKSEYEEREQDINLANNQQQGLRSPPLPSGTRSPRLPEAAIQGGSSSARNSPKLPPIALFTVSTKSPRPGTSSPGPRSPPAIRSPLKPGFRGI